MITDQIKKRVPNEFKDYYLDEWTSIVSPTKLVQKLEEFEDVQKTIRPNAQKNVRPREIYSTNWKNKATFNRNPPVKDSRPERFQTIKKEGNHESTRAKEFDKRKPLQCYECGSYQHLRPQCPKLKRQSSDIVNRVGEKSKDRLLAPYTMQGEVNGYQMPILRDTGATIDIICQKYITPDLLTGEHVWVQHILDERSECLPIAKVVIKCDLGHVITKAAVIANKLDQGRYLLGNETAVLLEKVKKKEVKISPEVVNAVQTRAQKRKETIEATPEINEWLEPEREQNDKVTDRTTPEDQSDKAAFELIKVNSKKFIDEQRKCTELSKIIKQIEESENGEVDGYHLSSEGHLLKQRTCKNGEITELLVVPQKFRPHIQNICHEGTSGHLGVAKTKARLSKHFFWQKCYKDVESHVKSCDPCQRAGKASDRKKAPLTLVPVIPEIFSKINVDACGPLPLTPNGNKYLITVICLGSKYPDAIPVPDITSESVVNALMQIFSRMGFPKEIQLDQGTSFMSNLAIEFLQGFGIEIKRSSVYHPQSNPVERFHRTIKRILRVLCLEASSEWEKHLPAALFALRTITHESTGFTPAELVHGKNLRTPVTLLYEKWLNPPEEQNSVVEYVFELINRLKKSKELADEKMAETRQQRKKWYDKKAIKREFYEGDLVLVFSMCRKNKLDAQWKGPGKIEKKISDTNYVVGLNERGDKTQVYHINMLKPYYKRAELINVVSVVENDSDEISEDFPQIDHEPTVFDFEDIIKKGQLERRLNEHQLNQLHELLCRYSKIFSNIPGRTPLVQHDIELVNNNPIRLRPYRTSPRQNEILIREIDKMLQHKVIEVGESDYTSPMILVEAPGREPRPCIDYRKLNEVTRTQYYPLPNIEHRVETVASAKFISVLDLTKGYWQIPLTANASRLAAFTTNFGTYRPLRMPFGLKNAPYYFSKMMAELLRGCENFAIPYLDDIAVYSKTWEEHLQHLDDVLQRIQKANLTIKPLKCKFAQAEVQYLGHVVGKGKRTPTQIKVQAIQDFPKPTTKTEVRAFLGLAGYYRQYIPMFSATAAPLSETLKGKTKKGMINWSNECEKAFHLLKEKLSNHPVLYAPDFTREFIIQTDASDKGLGIVLAQRNDKKEEHPVLYLSKKFTEVEKKYCTTEKECAAIIYAVKKLRCYLDGQTQFIIQTDHNPLVWLRTNAGNNPRLMRWALALQPYNYEIQHRRGKDHINADCLSRYIAPV